MSLINMLTWWQWAILAVVPPAIVALYFLKLKRQPLEVPSTYLWHKSIEDLHVNSIWQRLRQNLLLFLQLLLLLLVILALIRPNWQGTALVGDRFVFLVDNSASMSAVDVEPTRLDEAKRQVAELIDQMRSSDQAMIVSFNEAGQVVQEFTNDRQRLRDRLASIGPTRRTTSLTEALQLAAALANPGREDPDDTTAVAAQPATLYIFSDGKFPAVQGFSLGNLKPVYVPIGSKDARNVGILTFSTRRHEVRQNELLVFFQLHNFSDQPATVTAELLLDDEPIDVKEVTAPAGEDLSDGFLPLRDIQSGVLKLRITSRDPFAVDDVAYAAVNTPRRGRVLLATPGNELIEHALSTRRADELADVAMVKPEYLRSDEYEKEATAGAYDLVIYDQCRPDALPAANTLFIGRLPPAAVTQADGDAGPRYSSWSDAAAEQDVPTASAPQVIDFDRTHPLMRLIELGDVFIGTSYVLTPPEASTTLIDSTKGILLAIAPRGGYEDAVLGFELIDTRDDGGQFINSDWWRRQSFPTFWLNVLRYLGGHLQEHAAASVKPGQIYRIRTESPVEEITVRRPDGSLQTVARGKRNEFAFSGTDQIGAYDVIEGEKVTQRFTVNLFDRTESDIKPRVAEDEPVQIGYVEVAATADFEPTRREVWKFLLLAGLAILLFEWYIYNRRVYL